MDYIPYGEARFYQGDLIRCQGYHDDYACSCQRVAMLGSDWNGFQYSRTCCQVHVGACGHVLKCQALNIAASQGPGSSGAYPVLKAPGHSC
jgi:hypothetical protein